MSEFLDDITINFDRIKQNLISRGRSRLLSQFYTSELLNSVLDCISEEIQEVYNAIEKTIELRTLEKAQGVNLDTLGALVGAEKKSYGTVNLLWFTPDESDLCSDAKNVNAWVSGAPIQGDGTLSYEEWLKIIKLKIYKNQCIYASYPEIRQFIKLLSDTFIKIFKTGSLDAILCVDSQRGNLDDQTLFALKFLTRRFRGIELDYGYFMPLPPDVILDNRVWFIETDGFTPDTTDLQCDIGLAVMPLPVI